MRQLVGPVDQQEMDGKKKHSAAPVLRGLETWPRLYLNCPQGQILCTLTGRDKCSRASCSGKILCWKCYLFPSDYARQEPASGACDTKIPDVRRDRFRPR